MRTIIKIGNVNLDFLFCLFGFAVSCAAVMIYHYDRAQSMIMEVESGCI